MKEDFEKLGQDLKESFEELGKEFEDFGKEVEALFKNTQKTELSKYGFEFFDRNKDGKITDADFYQTDSEDGITMKETDYSQWKNLVQNEKVPNVRSSSLKDNCEVGMQCVGFKCVHEISFKPIPGFDLGIKLFRTTQHVQKCVEKEKVKSGQGLNDVSESQILKKMASVVLQGVGIGLKIANRLPKNPLTAIVLDSLAPPKCQLMDTKADGFCCVGYQATMAETVTENFKDSKDKEQEFKRLPATQEECKDVAQSAIESQKKEASSVASSACFPAGSQVVTPTGLERMDKLVVGDLVLTSAGFKPVMYFGHANPLVSTTFYNLHTSAGMVIKATPLHDIILHDPHDHAVVVKSAKSVQPGDQVWVYVNSSYRFADSVKMVYRTTETGIFTPRTETNDVVVDWVLATCDTSDMRSISTVLHGFMRSMYFLFPSVFIFMDNFARSPSQLKTTEGMTFWLPQQIVLPFFKAGFFGCL